MAFPTQAETYPAGTLIGDRYRIEDVLGIGGFGAVYRCTQLNMDQIVAVKVLKGEHITSDEHVKRFEREARAASRLRHPNTISMFDFGKHSDGALYLAMEYLEGETLADRLDSGNTLTAQQLVHIMAQVCHSLTEAHQSNLVHRDLKPENIMLMSVAGDPNYVKVLDFGIAKVEDDNDAHEERLTEMGMIMGTPTYMSPEQAYGKILDARSDIYALGVLMYEALTGRVPFEGDKPMEVLVKHINNPPTPPTAIVPDLEIPIALEKAVLRCLEKKPDDRPQSTRELADLLVKALHTPDDTLQKGRPVDAPQEVVATTTHVPELAEQTTAVPATAPRRASAQRPAATTGSTASPKALWIGLAAFSLVAIVAVSIALLAGPTKVEASNDKPAAEERAAPTAVQTAKTTEKAAPAAVAQPRAAGTKQAPVPAPKPAVVKPTPAPTAETEAPPAAPVPERAEAADSAAKVAARQKSAKRGKPTRIAPAPAPAPPPPPPPPPTSTRSGGNKTGGSDDFRLDD